jgi:anti-sigma-K factor RskA
MDASHITEEQADEYAIGAMEPEVAGFVALHIDACDACRVLVDQSRRAAAAMALGLPRARPPERLKARVYRSAGIARPGFLAVAFRVAATGTGVAAVTVAIAALVGLVGVRGDVRDLQRQNLALQRQVQDALAAKVEIAAVSQRLEDEERVTKELRAAAGDDRQLLIALMSPGSNVAEVTSVDERATAVGRLVWDEEQKRVWFLATNLDALPPAQTYQLWVFSGGRYVSLGTFRPDESGFARHVMNVPQGLRSYESAVVTIERAPGAYERQGPSVFVMDLSRLRE